MRRLSIAILGPLATQFVVHAALADTAKFADPGKAAALPGSGVSSMGQVTVALFIVLAVLFAAAWAMRRFKMFTPRGKGSLEVVQGISVGPKERAVLIKMNERRLLLGVAPGCVNLLLELPPETPGGESTTESVPAAPDVNAPNFKALLKRSMGLS